MFLLGSTAGAVVALLTAPNTGKETRRRLRSTLQQVGDKAVSVSGTVADSFSRGSEALREGVASAFEKDPVHKAGAQEEDGRPATGTASKTGTTSSYNSLNSPSRAGQSYSSNSPK
jgi:hypothetical protein